MTFSSPIFLFVFFPIVLLLYCLLPNLGAKNALLIVASLLFYAYGEPFAMLLMLVVVLLSWGCARVGDRFPEYQKLALTVAVVGNLGLLGVYKYAGFFVETLNVIPGISLSVPNIALPIGISFFIFQAVSYNIDVYRKVVPAQRYYHRLLLYISFFPQLIAGPIVRYPDIAEALTNRQMTLEQTASGFRRMIVGLSKKLLLADTLGQIADEAHAMGADLAAPMAWLGASCYMLQIYFDFSGYSDMAIGMGRIFGFHFPENFRHPYCASSITEFWKRWHISLTTWFRECLYFPLGGNRKGKWRTVLNKWIVFFCTGLWHGASWNFVLWGLLNGLLMNVEQLLPKPKTSEKIRYLFGRIYAVLAVMLAFVLFRAETLTDAANYYHAMFRWDMVDHTDLGLFLAKLSPMVMFLYFVAILACTPLVQNFYRKIIQKSSSAAQNLANAVTIFLLAICMLNVAATTYHPFIYFRF